MDNKKYSKEVEKIVSSINELLEKHENIKEAECMFADDIQTILNNIKRIKQEFDASMFFVVAAGAIKSGKSTLINLLAHKNVSTTKQGKETTLRPAIICAGEEDAILLFSTTKSSYSDEEKEEVFDVGIDYIKGFVLEEELENKGVKVKKIDFSEGNAAKYLTEKNFSGETEPVLINIQVKIDKENHGNSLLNQGIAIIDTPGIDGILAGAEGPKEVKGLKEEEKKFALMNRVDLMLFLQSSVTPINSESSEYIKHLKEKHSITNIRLIHNKFTLKPWREDLDIPSSDADTEAIESAQKTLRGVADNIKANIVDFAKAEDGYEHKQKELLEESGFEVFEKELLEDLLSNKDTYQDKRVKESLELLIKQNIGTIESPVNLKTLKKKIDTIETGWKDEEKGFTDKLDSIGKFFRNNKLITRLVQEGKEEGDSVGWKIKENIAEIKAGRYNDSILGDKVKKEEEIISEFEKAIKGENKYFRDILNQQSQFNEFLQNSIISDEKSLQTLIDEFNGLHDSLQLEKFTFTFPIDEYYKEIDLDCKGIVNQVRNFCNIWGIRPFSKDQIGRMEGMFKEKLKEAAEDTIKSFRKKLIDQIDMQFAAYAETIWNTKQNVQEQLKIDKEDSSKGLPRTKEIRTELSSFFKNLQNKI